MEKYGAPYSGAVRDQLPCLSSLIEKEPSLPNVGIGRYMIGTDVALFVARIV